MGLLVFVTIAGIGMAGVGYTWQYRVQSQKEKELLFIGRQYRQAIESYQRSNINGANSYPTNLQDLLLDKRFPTPKRHLRQLYHDPFLPSEGMVEIKNNGFIIGVHSHSQLTPLKKVHFMNAEKAFEDAETYQDWKFIFQPLPAIK